MIMMFYGDKNLETIYVSNLWDVTKVTQSGLMFYKCEKLRNYDPSSTSKVRANTSETGYLTLKS